MDADRRPFDDALRIVTPAEWRRVTWRNGLGVSDQIAERPGLVLNRTPLAQDVPFSSYPGFDRLFAVLAGRVVLDIDGVAVRLAAGELHEFPGEATVAASLGGGSAEVLNLILDRALWRACGNVLASRKGIPAGQGAIVHAVKGPIMLGGGAALRAGDTAMSASGLHIDASSALAVLFTVSPASRR